MVIREPEQHDDFFVKVEGKWVRIDRELLSWHPGGNALVAYKNKDATTAFHTFHVGSKWAYKMLSDRQKKEPGLEPQLDTKDPTLSELYTVNMGQWQMEKSKADEIAKDFDRLRLKVRQIGLLDGSHFYYVRKFLECVSLICAALWLQSQQWYVTSALVMGLAWQQLGWMIHEYCHHQHFKTWMFNDYMSYIVGNLMQGFSSGGWKNQHNISLFRN